MAYGIVNVPGGAGQDLGPLETAVNAASTTAVTANTKAGNAYNQANAAYNKANTASSAATAANTRASSAYTQANAAYDKANTASTTATAANAMASSAFDEASAANTAAAAVAANVKILRDNLYSVSGGDLSIPIGWNAQCRSGSRRGIAIGASAAIAVNSVGAVALGGAAWASSSYCIAIGFNASAQAMDSVIAIGAHSRVLAPNSVALGPRAETTNANSIQLGSSSNLSSITAKVSITVTSDERDKADIEDLDNAMEFLRRVRAFRYKANPRDLYAKEIDPNKSEEEYTEDEKKQVEYQRKYGFVPYDKEAHAAGAKKGSRVRVGVSAQEVQRALVDVYNDIGYANLVNDNLFDLDPDTIPEDVESHLGVSYENFIPFLIQAVQELDRRTSILEGEPA